MNNENKPWHALGFAVEAGNPASVATPAAASAGAAGTIDTPALDKLLGDFRAAMDIDTKNRAVLAIHQHVAAAATEARNAGYFEGMRAGPAQATEGGAQWGAVKTVTMNGHQLREALEFINPNGAADELQADDELTFGVVQHKDDDGNVSTGLCCWNDDTDGVYPLDGEPRAATAPVSAAPTAESVLIELLYNQMVRSAMPMPLYVKAQKALGRLGNPQSAGAPVAADHFERTAAIVATWPKWKQEFTAPSKPAGAPVSAAETVQQIQATLQAGEHWHGAFIPAGSAAEPACRWPTCLPEAEQDKLADEVMRSLAGETAPPADGQELPALQRAIDLVEQIAANTTADYRETAAQALLALRQPQPQPATYRLCAGWECARMEPDPAGEWVKRADLAMGQKGGT